MTPLELAAKDAVKAYRRWIVAKCDEDAALYMDDMRAAVAKMDEVAPDAPPPLDLPSMLKDILTAPYRGSLPPDRTHPPIEGGK